jgi:hypothetical protein
MSVAEKAALLKWENDRGLISGFVFCQASFTGNTFRYGLRFLPDAAKVAIIQTDDLASAVLYKFYIQPVGPIGIFQR